MRRDRHQDTVGECDQSPTWTTILPRAWPLAMVARPSAALASGRMVSTLAAISALEALTRPVPVQLYTDSKYVLDGITKWVPGWQRNGWKTSSKQPVKNVDLWQRLVAAMAGHEVSWHWVKGHNGDPGNERADELGPPAASRKRPQQVSLERAEPLARRAVGEVYALWCCQHLPKYAPLWYVVHGSQLVPSSDRVIADLAFWNGLRVASEPFEPLICQRPKSSVGLIAFGLPPDSAIAISAAMSAAAGLPPACSQICSRPEQLYMPCAADWVTSLPLPSALAGAALRWLSLSRLASLTVEATGWAALACFGT